MTIAAIGTTSNTTATSNIGLQDFLKVLLTQLTYQDPLKPVDNQQFMANIAQFTALGQTQELNVNVQHLLSNQAALQSVGFIGRTVDVTTSAGTVTGTVRALSLAGAAPKLTIQTTDGATINDVDLSQIVSVR
jgi:flagellar basal-body rod modification protein FlgD